MKKRIFMGLVMAAAVGLCACSQKETASETTAVAAETSTAAFEENAEGKDGNASGTDENLKYDSQQFISMMTSTPGGGMYNMAAAIAPIWEENLNVVASIGPGGSFSNFNAVAKGETNIGFSHQCMHYWAERGEGPFEQKVEGLSTLSTLFPATVQMFTTASNTDIQSLADIEDKRIGLGAQGSALNIFILDYLKQIYGITPDTITAKGGSISYMSDSEMSSALSDGIIDIGFALGTYPKSSIQEIENSPGIRFIEFGDDLQKYLDSNTGWDKFTIPAGTYAGQDKDYETATSWAVMTVSDTMDEELAYRLTKSMWENITTAGESCFEINNFMKLETATAAMEGASLHPGAERYYKEVGILK